MKKFPVIQYEELKRKKILRSRLFYKIQDCLTKPNSPLEIGIPEENDASIHENDYEVEELFEVIMAGFSMVSEGLLSAGILSQNLNT